MDMKTVAKKAVHHAKKHKYKIILGAPIIFAIFVNVDMANPASNILSVTTDSPHFVTVGETVSCAVSIQTTDVTNAVGGAVVYDPVKLSVPSTSFEGSLIDLWAEKPQEEKEPGKMVFAGGITRENGFKGTGPIFLFTARPTEEGVVKISLQNPEILANNGEGTNLLTQKKDLVLYVRREGFPSPDVNHDSKVSLMDINIVYFNSLRKYNPSYDLNGDGTVSLGDVRILLSLM